MSEFRYCKLTNEWTLFAPERLKRPINFMPSSKNSLAQDASSCPFDSGKEEYTPSEITRIAQKDAWQCRVVPNLYNALSLDHPFNSQRESYFEKMRGFGAHEVIIETPHHDRKMPSYDYNEFVNYLTIIQERAINLKKDIRLAHLSVFKNQGQEAGASLYHSHTQLMALPFVPKEFNTMIEDQKSY
ncbi:MAG: galactose-1-phosphate uridylyltransferase, partial [Campylobacterota bacterium]|nr:galactose-1-phosphate uridylyltransferase [Campylobacterota bacterium]